MPDKATQRLATEIYLSGKCSSLEDAYKQAEQQLAKPGQIDLENLFGFRR